MEQQPPPTFNSPPPSASPNPPKKKTSPWIWVGGGCGVLFLGSIILTVVLFAVLLSGNEGGVCLNNEMEEYATLYLDDNKVLNGSEEIIAYYDVTLKLDSSECAILTTENLIYHRNGKNTTVPRNEIEAVNYQEKPFIGHVIEVESTNGLPIKIEIAPFNQGDVFIRNLEKIVAENKPEAAATN